MALQQENVFKLGVALLTGGLAAMLLSGLAAYPLAHYFSLGAQVVAHIVFMLAAVPLKLGYVACLAGSRGSTRIV